MFTAMVESVNAPALKKSHWTKEECLLSMRRTLSPKNFESLVTKLMAIALQPPSTTEDPTCGAAHGTVAVKHTGNTAHHTIKEIWSHESSASREEATMDGAPLPSAFAEKCS